MKRPAEYFLSQADDARVTRLWSHLDARLTRAQRRRPWLQSGALLLSAAALIMLTPRGWLAHPQAPEQQVLHLADGSRVQHAASDPVQIVAVTPERIELRMSRGRAHFEVTPNLARSFLTHAGEYTIRVVGTGYTVDMKKSGVGLEVTHGEVEVQRDRDGVRWRVRGGERWVSSDPPPMAARERAPEPPSVALEETLPLVAAEAPARAQRPRAKHERASGEAAQLFQRAMAARATGALAECERQLSELLKRYPRDARAGLAAFQLGRVRLELGDARGALSALDRAARDLGTFEEQIEARRVQALEQLGERSACQAARDAFVHAYPDGSFTGLVRQRCP